MKNLAILVTILIIIAMSHAFLTRKIPAQSEGCVEERCGTLCGYEDQKLFPGTSLTVYRELTCLQMICTDDFHVRFEPCPYDASGRCHFENYDRNLTWPDCCGIKVCM